MSLRLKKSFLGFKTKISMDDPLRKEKIVLFWREITIEETFLQMFDYMNDEFIYGAQIDEDTYFVGISSAQKIDKYHYFEIDGVYNYHECVGRPSVFLREKEYMLQITTFPIVEIYPEGDTEDSNYVSYLCVRVEK